MRMAAAPTSAYTDPATCTPATSSSTGASAPRRYAASPKWPTSPGSSSTPPRSSTGHPRIVASLTLATDDALEPTPRECHWHHPTPDFVIGDTIPPGDEVAHYGLGSARPLRLLDGPDGALCVRHTALGRLPARTSAGGLSPSAWNATSAATDIVPGRAAPVVAAREAGGALPDSLPGPARGRQNPSILMFAARTLLAEHQSPGCPSSRGGAELFRQRRCGVLKAGRDTSVWAGRCYAWCVGPTEASIDAPVRTGSGSATRIRPTRSSTMTSRRECPPVSVDGKGAL